jgi:hypothetical protein
LLLLMMMVVVLSMAVMATIYGCGNNFLHFHFPKHL